MTIPEFVTKAIQGGWKFRGIFPIERAGETTSGCRNVALYWKGDEYSIRGNEFTVVEAEVVLLDPKAWEAVGQVQRWPMAIVVGGNEHITKVTYKDRTLYTGIFWLDMWHGLLDALANEQTIEQYLETL